ncbi:sensor histidine kinase [Kushneria phosphatilytica]|uniref:histidine kinase n=1 Tax=Kushneria phosphatilytica TaxID=657387 RepID=A0A1S1NX25_9GAMM|nr:sensor histidine kinase KdpD [Kushneria phosphatilytica]OHV12806.1 two-component sensor histidine kinase [Kushneria phosphatilytica]QEL10653.1 sensor histidine kinase KdpD [Kushneria phosphatilytica]
MNGSETREALRPDPDALLRTTRREARGCLRLFLGAAPGVGKTFAMLRTARDRIAEGEEIVIGVIESHGREDTENLCEGIERIPLAECEHQGRRFQEFDLDAVLKRAPTIVLVDELAHRNIPGGRHPRRYQDIEELLEAGIDVWTTLNVQHIESLNDAVARITGIRMRETVPDSLITRARDITLIDLTPDELIQRLRQGKIYVPEQARAALDGFFSVANLTALRELAMQTMAERVDSDVRDSMGALGAQGPWPVRPRVLIALSGRPEDASLIRAAHRLAERRSASWQAIHIDTGDASRTLRLDIERSSQLVERLGGDMVVVPGQDRVAELLAYARRHNITTLIIGRRTEPPWHFWHRSMGKQLLRQARDFDLVIVAGTERREPFHWLPSRRITLNLRDWLPPLLILPGTLGLALLIDRSMELANLSLVFLTGVLITATYSGTRAAMLSAVLSFLAYNFFFTEPRYTLAMVNRDQLLTVFFFFVVATIGGQLAGRARRQLIALRASRDQTRQLLQFSRALSISADHASARATGVTTLANWLQTQTVFLEYVQGEDELQITDAHPGEARLEKPARQAATWSWHHRRPSGHGSQTLASQHWRFIPLVEKDEVLGVIGLALGARDVPLEHDQEILIDTLLNQLSMALARTRLVHDLGAARLAEENERLRSALLSSVSHDLRTPLASIIGAASSLRDLDDQLSQHDKRELLDGVLGESERLNRYIQNLLDMTRLGHGTLKIERDWVALADLINAALKRLATALDHISIERDWPAELPLLYVHPALIEQALVNVIENAIRFSPPDGRIRISAERQQDDLIVRISDEGPGIPEALREQVFDMFFTGGEGDRGKHGSGLGLAICRGMIGAHGGSIHAESNSPGQGTSIVIRLPLLDSADTDPDSEAVNDP